MRLDVESPRPIEAAHKAETRDKTRVSKAVRVDTSIELDEKEKYEDEAAIRRGGTRGVVAAAELPIGDRESLFCRGVAFVVAFYGTPAHLRPSEREGLRSGICLREVRPSSTRFFFFFVRRENTFPRHRSHSSRKNKSDKTSCIRRIITTGFFCDTWEPR